MIYQQKRKAFFLGEKVGFDALLYNQLLSVQILLPTRTSAPFVTLHWTAPYLQDHWINVPDSFLGWQMTTVSGEKMRVGNRRMQWVGEVNFTLPNINIVTPGSTVFLELFSLHFIYNFDFIASILHSFYFLVFSFSSLIDVIK